MVRQKVVVKNPTGLHLRPAGLLCKEAMQFKCSVHFIFHEVNANAKSVLSVLSACVKCGDEVEFVCDGEDEETALKSIIGAIEAGLGEDIE
ncbi:MAG: HPr family phosphocarrier protein [Lachnospiraceae bacterium]|jgi:phosphocarrier protein HPr|nr:HPr family phosphocarrier protein [Lachnospiraceae bacterium]